jgi:signal transduction histidine kinase
VSARRADPLAEGTHRLLRPRSTIRFRLTLLYGGLVLLSGVALLAITYALIAHQFHGGLFTGTAVHQQIGSRSRASPGETVSRIGLGSLVILSTIALAIMALFSVWLGWLIAGRALRPLRTITDAVQDISARDLHRRLALDGPEDELRHLGDTFDELLERLQASFEAQRLFVANASHELRTPLTLQRTLLQVALADRDADTGTLREMGEDVLDASERQERLIDALLTLSRSQSGLDRREPVDLTAIAADTLHTLDLDDLTVETSLEPAQIRGDADLLERLVANVLGNAVRHNLPHGRIEIATRTEPGCALLSVTNTGPTIPPDKLTRLFQPFQRLDKQRTNSDKGIGLGLSIIDAIATAHNATLTAQPRAGGGLHIQVSFPTHH